VAAPCSAEDAAGAGYRFETYAGVDYDGRAASLTTSTVWSVFGPVNEAGFRIKLDGLADVYGNTNATVLSSSFLAADLKGLGDVMAGLQFQTGPFWIKLYAGAAYEAQARLFWEVGQIVQQQSWGAAIAAEGYWQVSDRVWASGALSWLQPDSSGSLYTRAAYEIYRDEEFRMATGAETGLTLGNADIYREGRALNDYNTYVRAGALINLRYGANDFSLSGGLSRASDEADTRPYATIRYGRQFWCSGS
jgi:Cellulose biosynthesis protein BcsS